MSDMSRWLNNYEHERTSLFNDGPTIGWTSSRYNLEDKDWDNIREIFIEPLDMTFKQAFSALKRSWFAYKRSRKEGVGYNSELGWRINRIQYYLGIPLTEFDGGLPINFVKQQLALEEGTGIQQTSEDLEIKLEEESENRLLWIENEQSENNGEPEDPLYAQLRQEERDSALAELGIDPYESEEEKKEREEQSDTRVWSLRRSFPGSKQ